MSVNKNNKFKFNWKWTWEWQPSQSQPITIDIVHRNRRIEMKPKKKAQYLQVYRQQQHPDKLNMVECETIHAQMADRKQERETRNLLLIYIWLDVNVKKMPYNRLSPAPFVCISANLFICIVTILK